MPKLSTNQAAKALGIGVATLTRYIQAGKVPMPPETAGGTNMRLWANEDIARLRKLLPKIKNGRKTRYSKKQLAASAQQSAKSKSKAKTMTKPQPRAAVPHVQSRKKSK